MLRMTPSNFTPLKESRMPVQTKDPFADLLSTAAICLLMAVAGVVAKAFEPEETFSSAETPAGDRESVPHL